MSVKEHEQYLLLKSGVSLTAAGNEYLLGLPTHGVLLTDGVQVQMARAFDGATGVLEIARGLHCDPAAIFSFAQILQEQGLLEAHDTPTNLKPGDLSSELIAQRTEVEKALLTHRAGIRDGGKEEFRSREQATILISGENRLARHLLVSLQASGFTNTRLISRAHLAPRIVSADVCGIVVRTSDMGKLRFEFTQELIRSARISHGVFGAKAEPDLIISTLPIEWDYVQRWMSEGSVHLHINPLIGQELEVGPLVIPGRTPCLRCVTLIKRANGSSVDREFVRSELPSAALAYISGLITLAIGEYFATGSTPLRAASHWYDLLSPLRPPDIRHWSYHPQCGCQ